MKTHIVNSVTVYIPQNPLEKAHGVIFREHILYNGCLLLTHCNWVHTFFLKNPIKLYFFDDNFNVVEIVDSLMPNKLSPLVFKASHTLETSVDFDQKILHAFLLYFQEVLRT